MSCVDTEQLVAYWANDLAPDVAATVEEHLFACDECAANAQRIHLVVWALRAGPRPVLSPDELAALRTGNVVLVETLFAPGEGQSVTFAANVDFMIHHLGGLDLARAERVELIVRSLAHGVLFEVRAAPFDRARGEVLVACQYHFSAFPPDIVFDVRVHRPSAPPEIATYMVPHIFEPR